MTSAPSSHASRKRSNSRRSPSARPKQDSSRGTGRGRGGHRRRAGRRKSSQRSGDRLTVAVEWIDQTGAALGAVGSAVAVEREAAVGTAPAAGQHLEQRPARRVRCASRTRQRHDLPDRWTRSLARRAGACRQMPRGDGRFARRQIRDGGRLRSAGQRADRRGRRTVGRHDAAGRTGGNGGGARGKRRVSR